MERPGHFAAGHGFYGPVCRLWAGKGTGPVVLASLISAWLVGLVPSSLAQEAGTYAPVQSADPAAQLWQSPQADLSWVIGSEGKPKPKREKPTPSLPARPAPKSTARKVYQPPVMPAELLPSSTRVVPAGGPGASPGQSTPRGSLQEIQLVDADTTAPTQRYQANPAPGLPVVKPEPSLPEIVGDQISAGGQAVVGAFNWVRLESKDLMARTVKPLGKFRIRRRCADCGRRHVVPERETTFSGE